MARSGTVRKKQPLPEPLPPETRTVGQLVAETLRLYGARFWPSLALGILPAVAGVGQAAVPDWARVPWAVSAGGFLLTATYVRAATLVGDVALTARSARTAMVAGMLVFLPVPFLVYFYYLPAVLWLALLGLVVPVAVIERVGLRAAFRRTVVLARADYVHAAGSLATLAIVGVLTSFVLFFLLRDQGEVALQAAGFLTLLVLSPVLFLGAALLYYDQAARVKPGRA